MRKQMWWTMAATCALAAGCGGDAAPGPGGEGWMPNPAQQPLAGMGMSSDPAPSTGPQPAQGTAGPTGETPNPSVPDPSSATPQNEPPGEPAADPTSPVQPVAGDDPTPVAGDPGAPFDYDMEAITLTADLVIEAGTSLRVGPGTVFTAQGNSVRVVVRGELHVEGTAEAPVRFVGAGLPRSWYGIVVEDGGQASLAHVEIGGATYGIHAQSGSQLSVDHADIGTSFKAAVVESDAVFEHVQFHGSGDPTFAAVNDVSIDGVNGNLTILDASPSVRDCRFDGSAPLVDVIRVGGDASPHFERIHIVGGHCGLHTYGGVNSAPQVTDSIFEGMAYGLMAYTAAPVVKNSAFLNNAVDVGFCFDATTANTPALSGNYYSAGAPGIDPSCFQIGTTDGGPLAAQPNGIGPSGL